MRQYDPAKVIVAEYLVESGDLELLSSEALEFEIDHIPHQHRKGWATEMLKLANYVIELNDEIEAQADSFVQAGIQPMDALHLASATWTKVDWAYLLVGGGHHVWEEAIESLVNPR